MTTGASGGVAVLWGYVLIAASSKPSWQKASEQFQDLYDNAPCGYYALDSQGKVRAPESADPATARPAGARRSSASWPRRLFYYAGRQSTVHRACFPVSLQNGKVGLNFNLVAGAASSAG